MSANQASPDNNSSPITYRNIALAGDVGTGTTTLGKTLAATLGWQHINAGAYFREWHRQHGIPLENTTDIPEQVDRELDNRFQADMKVMDQTVFESHLAGWLAADLPQTFKILCVVDQEVAIERIASREGWTVEESRQYSLQRAAGMQQKFRHLYGVDNSYNPDYFHVIIDTTNMSAGAVLDEALKQFLSHQPDGHQLAEVLDLKL